jgi:hypothetical protein
MIPKRTEGVGYMRPIFETGLLRNAQDVQSALDSDLQANAMPRGLPDAYWEWAKNQGYESTVQIRNLPECKPVAELASKILPIRPDYPSPRSAQYEEAEQAASNLIKFDFTEPKSKTLDVQRSMTRVIPIRFTNPDTKPVKITLTSNAGPALNYKVYRGTVPASTTDCTSDPEGTVDGGKSRIIPRVEATLTTPADPLFPVDDKTELVVFVANTDFASNASFTLKVEPIGPTSTLGVYKSVAGALTPLAPGERINLFSSGGETVSTMLTLTNDGQIGSSMNFTTYPIGNRVSSGVTIASIRSPVGTPTGTASSDFWTASNFQPQSGTLRQTTDPVIANGETRYDLALTAQCPTDTNRYYPYGTGYEYVHTFVDIVYNTGRTDDYGTPNDASDDAPELEKFSLPVRLTCTPPQLQVLTYEVPREYEAVSGQPFTTGLTVANAGTSQSMSYSVSITNEDGASVVNTSGSLLPGASSAVPVSGTCPNVLSFRTLHYNVHITSSDPRNPNRDESLRVLCRVNGPFPRINQPFFGYGKNYLLFTVNNDGAKDMNYNLVMNREREYYDPVTNERVKVVPLLNGTEDGVFVPDTVVSVIDNVTYTTYLWRYSGLVPARSSRTFIFKLDCESFSQSYGDVKVGVDVMAANGPTVGRSFDMRCVKGATGTFRVRPRR